MTEMEYAALVRELDSIRYDPEQRGRAEEIRRLLWPARRGPAEYAAAVLARLEETNGND